MTLTTCLALWRQWRVCGQGVRSETQNCTSHPPPNPRVFSPAGKQLLAESWAQSSRPKNRAEKCQGASFGAPFPTWRSTVGGGMGTPVALPGPDPGPSAQALPSFCITSLDH